MFESITSGWKLGAAVRKLVFEDEKLLVFPVMAGIIILIETIVIFAAMILSGAFNSLAWIAGLFAYYIIVYFTSAYLLVAMLIAFRSFRAKKQMRLSEAFSQTASYVTLIFEWAVFEAVITMIIRAIEQRIGGIGSVIFGLGASIAMSVASAFAIPVIVDKRTGPIATIKESTGFIFKNFGKTFGGLIYSELYSLIFVIAGVLLLVIGIFALGISAIFGVMIAIIGVLLLVLGTLLGYILSNVYRFVLYDYMNGGTLPNGITSDMVDASIRKRNQKPSAGIFGGGFGGQKQ
jgi:hypothetical protein